MILSLKKALLIPYNALSTLMLTWPVKPKPFQISFTIITPQANKVQNLTTWPHLNNPLTFIHPC